MNDRMNLLQPREFPPTGMGYRLLGKEEEELVLGVMRRKALNRYYAFYEDDPPLMAATLEREFCEKMGVSYALGMTSGTAALETALAALGVGPGDEVIVPAWSWISDFSAIVRVGARPVLAEIDESLCLAPGEIDRLVTARTKVVLVIHYQGAAAAMTAILEAARRHSLRVIEDCAQAVGGSHRGRRLGSLGDVGIYSFQNNKCLTSGEGGMLVTNDPVLYERAVRYHDLGLMRPFHAGLKPPGEEAFSGCQFRMAELTAAVALAQLRKLDGLIAHVRELSELILQRIENRPGLTMRTLPCREGMIGFELYFFVEDAAAVTAFAKHLVSLGVPYGRTTHTYAHYMSEYCEKGLTHTGEYFPGWSPDRKGYRAEEFPVTERLVSRCISIPLGALFQREDALFIAKAIVEAHEMMSSFANSSMHPAGRSGG